MTRPELALSKTFMAEAAYPSPPGQVAVAVFLEEPCQPCQGQLSMPDMDSGGTAAARAAHTPPV